MNDITRIHIAKVPYNIELTAKKNLEKYISSLEMYMNDKEVLQDIEIRMTELLLERGVKQDDVISDADVTAIREQLGEPKEFMSDDGADIADAELLSETTHRKLYRNPDVALLGGVFGGIASYLRINVVWLRLIAIVLSFITFGLFVLLYIVLWLIIPSARTAAEKLHMAGRRVTLTSIRELNESNAGFDSERHGRILKRIATIIIGVGSLVFAALSATALAAGLYRLLHNGQPDTGYQLSIALIFGAGLLLIILFLLIAFAAFARKFNKRIWVSGIVIIVLGLGTFGTAVISAGYTGQEIQDEIQRNTIQSSINLPDGFASTKTLTIDVADNTSVVYVVDESHSSIAQRMVKGTAKADVTVKDGAMKVHLAPQNQNGRIGESTITIYGPHLEKIIASNGYISYNSGGQTDLGVEAYNSSSVRLIGSRIDTLSVRTDESGQLSADDAAVVTAKVAIYGQSSVQMGNIKSLNVSNPDVCAANQIAQLTVSNIIASTYTHNGIEAQATSSQGPCLRINFGDTANTPYGGYQD